MILLPTSTSTVEKDAYFAPPRHCLHARMFLPWYFYWEQLKPLFGCFLHRELYIVIILSYTLIGNCKITQISHNHIFLSITLYHMPFIIWMKRILLHHQPLLLSITPLGLSNCLVLDLNNIWTVKALIFVIPI